MFYNIHHQGNDFMVEADEVEILADSNTVTFKNDGVAVFSAKFNKRVWFPPEREKQNTLSDSMKDQTGR